MKFNLKLNSKDTSNIDTKNIIESVSRLWQKTQTMLFFVFLIGAIVIGGYIWQQNIYSGGWSSEKKQEYLDAQNKEVIFNEKDFKKVSDDISSRKNENIKEYQPIRDIFKPYQ